MVASSSISIIVRQMLTKIFLPFIATLIETREVVASIGMMKVRCFPNICLEYSYFSRLVLEGQRILRASSSDSERTVPRNCLKLMSLMDTFVSKL